jgi:DNA-binding NarL/FixJ family response regulator
MPSDTATIRILTVDDHALLRKGIAALINAEPDMELVAEATNGKEAITEFKKHRPDVTLMDLQMPEMSGIECIIAIRGDFPNARIIVLTTYPGDVQVIRALKAGARGYLLKGQVNKELLDAIRAVHRGQKRIPLEIATDLAEHTAEDDLSPREIDVLRLIAAGDANKEIAGKLFIAEETVKSHVTNILSNSCQRSNACRHHCPETRNHSALIPRNGDRAIPVSGLPAQSSISYPSDGTLCSGYFPHLPTVGRASVFSCCVCSRAPHYWSLGSAVFAKGRPHRRSLCKRSASQRG